MAVVVLDRLAGIPWRRNIQALARQALSALRMALVVSLARPATGPVGLVGLVGLVALGGAVAVAANVDVLGRVYREQRRRLPALG